MDFLSLPDELIAHIFAVASPVCVGRLSRSCRRLAHLSSPKDEHFWQVLVAHRFGSVPRKESWRSTYVNYFITNRYWRENASHQVTAHISDDSVVVNCVAVSRSHMMIGTSVLSRRCTPRSLLSGWPRRNTRTGNWERSVCNYRRSVGVCLCTRW